MKGKKIRSMMYLLDFCVYRLFWFVLNIIINVMALFLGLLRHHESDENEYRRLKTRGRFVKQAIKSIINDDG
jgi:hypothetical protein